jgi:hypothetical protein
MVRDMSFHGVWNTYIFGNNFDSDQFEMYLTKVSKVIYVLSHPDKDKKIFVLVERFFKIVSLRNRILFRSNQETLSELRDFCFFVG